MDPRPFHRRLFDAAACILPARGHVACAISGGLDSVAMLHGLVAVNEIHDLGWRIHVAHLDHRLRAESAMDALFVRDLAKSLGLECTLAEVDVAGEARAARESIEEAARRVRYRFLEDVARAIGAERVAVAHHADDQAETVLHRLARGAGLRGLAGMSVSRLLRREGPVQLVRPLLGFVRAELASYVAQRKLAYRHDASNDDSNAATRNWVRHELLPLLRERINPDITTALLRLAEQARRADDALRALALQSLRHIRIEQRDDQIILAAQPLAEQPLAVQSEIVIMILDRLGANRKEIGFERIDAILALIAADGRRRTLELPGGAAVIRRGRYLCFAKGPARSKNAATLEATEMFP